jgi:SET domain
MMMNKEKQKNQWFAGLFLLLVLVVEVVAGAGEKKKLSGADAAATCVDGSTGAGEETNGTCGAAQVTPTTAAAAAAAAVSTSSSNVSSALPSSSSSVCTVVEVIMESEDVDDEGDTFDSSTTWIVAGRDLHKGDAISQPDVFVPFRIHNRHTTWPLWRRHHYFWPPQQSFDDNPQADKDLLVFAPGSSHLSCHDRLHNIQYTAPSLILNNQTITWNENSKPYSTLSSQVLRASRRIARGDPLAMPCRDIDLIAQATYSMEDVHNFQYYYNQQQQQQQQHASVVGRKNDPEDDDSSSSIRSKKDVEEEEEDEDDELGGICSNQLVVGESTIPNIGKGAFATRHYQAGDLVTFAPVIHMHRHELWNNSKYELLLNYAYGHPDSPLLLLPNAPVVNYINHFASSSISSSSSTNSSSSELQPNVALTWGMVFHGDPIRGLNAFFNSGKLDKMLQRKEEVVLEVDFRAIRDIQPGDEILIDYGDAWQQAWDSQVETCRNTTTTGKVVGKDVATDKMETCMATFRHEIGVPTGLFPQQWLAQQKHKWDQEKRAMTAPETRKRWDLPHLQPGEIRRLQVVGGDDEEVEDEKAARSRFSLNLGTTSGINKGTTADPKEPAAHVYRVGLPPQLAPKMLDFADKMGLIDILYDYVKDGGNPMEKDATERHFINGGTWWAKRFESVWFSNMHYITPDDDKSNDDMLAALRDAGWVDGILAPLGRRFGLQGLMSYYASFIAVTHCTGSYLHYDAQEDDSHFNCILPLIQVIPNSSTTTTRQPELLLAGDAPDPDDYYSTKLILPYNYEPEAAICLGGEGLHSTGPVDYRGMPDGRDNVNNANGLPQNWRLALTVYLVDVNNYTMQTLCDGWHEPPYPYHYENFTREEFFWKNAGRDWKPDSTTTTTTSTITATASSATA